MSFVSVLLPAFFFEESEDLISGISEKFKVPEGGFQLCKIIDLDSPESGREEFAVKLVNSQFNMKQVECILAENQMLKKQLEKSKEALTQMSQEYQYVINNPEIPQELENQKSGKLQKKVKQLKDDNKKLRQLLKTQLENQEKMRIETQTTVETLREEFDLLVKELGNLQRKEGQFKNSNFTNQQQTNISHQSNNINNNTSTSNRGQVQKPTLNMERFRQQQQSDQ